MFSTLVSHLQSSVIKKQIMGITGLLLCGFSLSHLTGNLLILVGPEAFNTYAHTLVSNPLIYVAEFGLVAIFLTHLALAMKLTVENNGARPQKYYMKRPTGKGATFASSTMPYTGAIILIFLVLHILDFKYGTYYEVTYDGVVMRDLHRLIIEYFQNPINILKYLIAMFAFAIHVSHGFWSAFQSFGFNHPKYNDFIKMASKAFGVFVGLGFAALPLWCRFVAGGM